MKRQNRALLDLSIIVLLTIAFSTLSLSINFVDRLYTFFLTSLSLSTLKLFINVAFFFLCSLLWLTYGRWRKASRQQRELESIISSINPDVLMVVDADRNILMCNASVKEMFGYEVNELVGQKTELLYYDRRTKPDKRREIFEALKKQGFHIGLAVGKKKSGETVALEIITGSLRDRNGAVLLLRDITERNQAEEALRESEEKYRLLVENANDAIFVLQDGMIKFHNTKSEELSGYSGEELYTMPFAECIAPEDREMVLKKHRRRLRGENFPNVYSFRIQNKAGAEVCAEINAVLITWEGSPAVLCFVRDVSEQKKLESQLLQAQKMQAVGKLAAGVAHDFNNMMTAVLCYSERLLRTLSEENPMAEEIEKINKAGQQAASLTQQLLAFGCKQTLQPKTVDLNEVVVNMEKMLRPLIGEDIDLITVLGRSLSHVKADPTQIEQVIVNLALNARDAMFEGGKLTIKTENVTVDETYWETIPNTRPGRFICVSVEDTGVGMDKGTLDRIFEPFFSTKEPGKGSGLGLSAVYGIVKQHGGWVNVSSEPGHGSTFSVYLPADSVQAAVETTETISLETLQGRGERILLVEDEEGVRELVKRTLRENGYVVFEAETSEEALDIFERENGGLHLVFSDVVLPDKSGLQLAGELLSRNPKLRILLTSGYTDEKSQWSTIRERDLPFLKKPFTLLNLLQTVREAFDQN